MANADVERSPGHEDGRLRADRRVGAGRTGGELGEGKDRQVGQGVTNRKPQRQLATDAEPAGDRERAGALVDADGHEVRLSQSGNWSQPPLQPSLGRSEE